MEVTLLHADGGVYTQAIKYTGYNMAEIAKFCAKDNQVSFEYPFEGVTPPQVLMKDSCIGDEVLTVGDYVRRTGDPVGSGFEHMAIYLSAEDFKTSRYTVQGQGAYCSFCGYKHHLEDMIHFCSACGTAVSGVK